MAYVITEECINCAACEPECPTESIRAGEELFEIDANSCVECVGYFDSPKCAEVCPVECCVPA